MNFKKSTNLLDIKAPQTNMINARNNWDAMSVKTGSFLGLVGFSRIF